MILRVRPALAAFAVAAACAMAVLPAVARGDDVSSGDAVGVADSVTVVPPVSISVAEAIGATDAVTVTPPVSVSVAEGVLAADGVTVVPPATIQAAEGIGTADGVTVTPPAVITAGESVTASDAPSAQVVNTAPKLAAIGDQTAQEGSSFIASGSFDDPDAQAWTATVDYGDGGGAKPLTLAGKAFSLAHVYDDNGSYTVTIVVGDGLANGSGSFTVAVANMAPSGTAANNGPISEGGSAAISVTGVTDPSQADTGAGFTYAFDCGSGYGQPGPNPAASCSFDDNGTYPVKAKVSDKDGGSTELTTNVVVTNVAPKATLGNNGPVPEGGPATISFGDQSDPSHADDAAGFSYRYACDNGSLGAATTSSTATCTFDDGPSTHTVKGEILDKDGGVSDYTTVVAVTNVAPTATLVVPSAPVKEGSTFTLALQNTTDPSSADTAAGLTRAFDCGTGAGFQASPTCAAVDNSSQVVKGRITDKDGGSNVYTATVAVANVPPSVAITAPQPGALYQIGQPVFFSGSLTDPGAKDTHVAQWSFDSISVPGAVTETNGSGSVSASYTFQQPGVYSVRLAVTDKDGAVGTASTINGIDTFVVVYDPSAGFVTGGGWIDSPAGAYFPNPVLFGKANFGFVAKYKKGATVPDGDTEFQFKEADLNFHSTAYEWLVVAGTKAQFKGTGTLNGAGGYGFKLTVYDATPDRLRMKIWDPAGVIVYDNSRGNSDDIDDAKPQALGGGSIVIHR